ncbi:MAG: TonB-dependent receptor [Pseudomonadota bacterium]
MRTTIAAIIAACLSSVIFTQAHADDAAVLDGLTINAATRTQTRLEDTLASVRVITRDDIERVQANDVAEILRFVAGIDVARTGGPGQQTSLFTRGTESNHTLVLIDGVRMNPATTGGAAVQNVAPALIERIEIVTGPRSSLYGSDAIGAVINIVTRANSNDTGGVVSVRAGTNNLQRIHASARADVGTWRLSGAIDSQRTGGIPTRSFSDVDRGYDNLSANVSAARSLANGEIQLSHWQAGGTTEYADFFGNPVDQDYENSVSALEWLQSITADWDSRVLISVMRDDIDQNQSPDFITSTRTTLDWQNTYGGVAGHTLVGGVFVTQENADAISFGSGFDEDTDINALYMQDEFAIGDANALLAVRISDHDAYGSFFTWNAEIGTAITDTLSLQANLGRAFRAPDGNDRFGFGGNPELDPEVSNQWQARAIYKPAQAWQFTLEVFNNDIDDLIEFDFADFTLRNIGRAEIQGVSLAADWQQGPWRANLIINQQSADNADTGARLLRRAETSASLTVSREFGAHNVALAIRSDGDREDFGPVPLAGYMIASVTAAFEVHPQWQLSLRVDNLTDTEYETAASFRTQGRESAIQLQYQW